MPVDPISKLRKRTHRCFPQRRAHFSEPAFSASRGGQTNPNEPNAKPRFQAENAEMSRFYTRAGGRTNPMMERDDEPNACRDSGVARHTLRFKNSRMCWSHIFCACGSASGRRSSLITLVPKAIASFQQ